MHHLDLDLLQAVLGGELPPKTLLRRLLDHLGELCPECAGVVAALRHGNQAAEQPDVAFVRPHRDNGSAHREVVALPSPRLVGAIDRAQQSAAAWTKRVRQERRRARADLREIRGMPPEQRKRRVENARSRFRSRALAELLVDESRRLVRRDPAEARSLASLAEVVLLWTPGAIDQDWARELSLRAHAWEANAVRVSGDLRSADRLFTELRARLACEVCSSEALHGEICSLEASLRIDQGRACEAKRLLAQAARLFEAADDRQALGKVLMQWAIVERQHGDYEAAVRIQRRSLQLLDRNEDRTVHLQALVNLAFYLLGLDRLDEAAALLGENQPQLERHELWSTPPVHTLRGRIALARESWNEAEAQFAAARNGALQRGDMLRFALASFDLALLYTTQGRSAELPEMAQVMGRIFESQALHEEAMATVVLFQQAVAAETLTAEALRAWRRQLENGPWPGRARVAREPS